MKEKIYQKEKNDILLEGFSIYRKRLTNVFARISSSRKILYSISALFSSTIMASVLTAVGGLLMARFINPEVVGSFRAFTIPLMYLMFLNLGSNDGIQRQIPYYVGKEMPDRVDAVASAGAGFNLFLSIFISFGFVCCAVYSLAHHDLYGVFGWLSQAFASWSVFYGGYLIFTYRTMDHFVTMSKIQLTSSILTFGMVFLLPFMKFYGLCARRAFPSLLSVWLFHRNRPLKVAYRFNIKDLIELIKLGIQYSFWGNLYIAAWIATESVLVLYLSDVTALGLLSVAYAIRVAMNTLPKAVWKVLLPHVIKSIARDGNVRNANERMLWVTVGLTGIMMLLAYAGGLLLDILVPIFIPKYIAGLPVMKVSLWFSVVEAAFLRTNALYAFGRPWLYGRSIITGIIVWILATYLLLPRVGALLAVVIGSLLGRLGRTLAAYVDLIILARQEKIMSEI